MKKSILALAVCALLGMSAAQAVVLITDPVTAGTVQCGFYVDSVGNVPTSKVPVTTLTAAQGAQYGMPSGSIVCLLDISNIAVGPHTAQVTAFAVADPVWGTGESAKSVPVLNFTRPAQPSAPTAIRVTQ